MLKKKEINSYQFYEFDCERNKMENQIDNKYIDVDIEEKHMEKKYSFLNTLKSEDDFNALASNINKIKVEDLYFILSKYDNNKKINYSLISNEEEKNKIVIDYICNKKRLIDLSDNALNSILKQVAQEEKIIMWLNIENKEYCFLRFFEQNQYGYNNLNTESINKNYFKAIRDVNFKKLNSNELNGFIYNYKKLGLAEDKILLKNFVENVNVSLLSESARDEFINIKSKINKSELSVFMEKHNELMEVINLLLDENKRLKQKKII